MTATSAFVVAALALSAGIKAPQTPLAWVQTTDALYPDVAVGGKKLDAVLAKADDVEKYIELTGYPEGNLQDSVRAALAQQRPAKGAKADVHPDAALVADDADGVHVFLFDSASGKDAHLLWLKHGDVVRLLAAPVAEKRSLTDVVTSYGEASFVTYFTKAEGTWREAALPSAAACELTLARAKAQATSVYVRERKLDDGHYTADLGALGYKAPANVDVKLTSATPKHFTVVVTVGDAVVSAGDESFGLTIVKGDCAPAHGAHP